MNDGHLSTLVSIRDFLVEQRRSAVQGALQYKDESATFENRLSLLAQIQDQIDLIDRVIQDESQGANR